MPVEKSLKTDLRPIIAKLGHGLEEIRTRSLDNILSKLDHGLISELDLVHDKLLFVNLLEWFNKPSPSSEVKVLTLLHRLSKHAPASQLLLDIGSVPFLSQLRPNLSIISQSLLDQLLENLFRLPDSGEGNNVAPCVYQKKKIVDECSTPEQSGSSEVSVAEGRLWDSDSDALTVDERARCFPHLENEHQLTATARLPDATGSDGCFRFSSFPWLTLTPTDRHVLASVDSSLSSKDEKNVLSACDFLRDVVFNDFPPEIFLQRPAITKSLLSLVSLAVEGHPKLVVASSETLNDLCRLLASRLLFYQDPALYTPKIDIWAEMAQELSVMLPSDRRHMSRQQGDGRDDTRSSSSSRSSRSYMHELVAEPEFPLDEADDLQAVQFAQMSLTHYCVSLLNRVVPRLSCTDESVLTACTRLLYSATKLLCEALNCHVWTDGSAAAREMAERLVECLEKLALALHHHRHTLCSTPVQVAAAASHQLAYTTTALYAAHLVTSIVPVDIAKSVLPETLQCELYHVLMNEALACSVPTVRSRMLEYVSICSEEAYTTYQRTHHVQLAISATCQFLHEAQHYDPLLVGRWLHLAEVAVPALQYTLPTAFVSKFVNLASQIVAAEGSGVHVTSCRLVLMKLLAHTAPTMQRLAYTHVHKIVQRVLSVDNAVSAGDSEFSKIAFIIDRDVLYEISSFGLMADDKKVSELAQDVMLHLLQSQLLLPESMWATLLTVLASIMPILQGLADDSTALGQCIMALIGAEPRAVPVEGEKARELPRLERLRGTLRLLFGKTSRLRSEGLSQLAYYLSREPGASTKRPQFHDLKVSALQDIYLVTDGQRRLDDDANNVTVFSSDEMLKVFDIFHSVTIETKVRKSAADQLAIMMRDPTLHRAFMRKGGLDKITEVLHAAIEKGDHSQESTSALEGAESVQFVPPCLQMLQYLLYSDSSLRRRSAQHEDLYLPIVRCSLMYQSDSSVRASAASCLALLLFDEVTCPEYKPYSIPAFVAERYNFPLKTRHHHSTSPHSVTSQSSGMTSALTCEELASRAVVDRLRLVWNVNWYGGVEELLDTTNGDFTDESAPVEFSSTLKLTALDVSVLRSTMLGRGVQDAVHAVSNACTHAAVLAGLDRLNLYIATFQLHNPATHINKNMLAPALNRFLGTVPSSTADESLLSAIFLFLCRLCPLSLEPRLATWLENLVHKQTGFVQTLLSRPELSEDAPEASHHSRRNLLKCVHGFILRVIQTFGNAASEERKCRLAWRAPLVQTLYGKLDVMEAPEFYNLAALQATVTAVMHVTSRPGWSELADDTERWDLCDKLLVSLLEVTVSFQLGRADQCMSFMGRGVTRAAALSLAHLAREMALLHTDLAHDWEMRWLSTSRQSGGTGLAWLFPLWAYRDPVVRAAGLSVAVSLSGSLTGCVSLATCCQHLPGGVWRLATHILLDQTEASLARQQAALLLINLTAQPMPSSLTEAIHHKWTGPVVKNEDTKESMVGIPALQVLLHHSAFYPHVQQILSDYYPHPSIQPTCVDKPSVSDSASTLSTTVASSHVSAADVTLPESAQRLVTPSGEQATSTPNQPASRTQSCLSERPASRGSRDRSPLSRNGTSAGRSDTVPTPPRSTPRSLLSARSSTSARSDGSEAWQSVTSPALAAALCSLLKNLLLLMPPACHEQLHANNILSLLISMVDDELLEAYCKEMSEETDGFHLGTFTDIANLYTNILSLTQLCSMNLMGGAKDKTGHSQRVRETVLSDQLRLKKVVRLLKLTGPQSSQEAVHGLKEMVFFYLTSLLSERSALPFLTPVLVLEWDVISDSLSSILASRAAAELRVSAMTWTAAVLREELRLRHPANNSLDESTRSPTSITDMLALSKTTERITESGLTSGSVICEALISSYDVILNKPLDQSQVERGATINAFKSLLAASPDAKRTALEAGLAESLVEHLKRCHAKLSADVLHIGKSPSTKRRDDLLITDIRNTFDLLTNFMYKDAAVKVSCCGCGLAAVVHRLWAWCRTEPRLMTSALHLLLTLTTACKQAACSLAYTTSSSVGDLAPPIRPQLFANSLVHCLVKLASRDLASARTDTRDALAQSKDASRDHVTSAFSILAALTHSPEGRGIIWKSNFLSRFSSVVPGRKQNVKRGVDPVCWLHLLANLSFSTDGQQMIIKVKDSVDLLVEFSETSTGQCRLYSLLVLRNLAFHNVNKHKLLSHGKVIPVLLRSLGSGCEQSQVISSSALWALLYNNQKAKVAMRKHQVLPYLSNTLDGLADDVTMDPRVFSNLEAVIGTLTE